MEGAVLTIFTGVNTIKNMNATAKKLWNRNFLLYLIGMEFNLIGTNLLKFVLPFYVLLETGNPALMGTILAFSTIPLAIFIPIGGIVADRFSKKYIMVLMNVASAIVIIVYLAVSGTMAIVPATIIFFLLFSSFESMISPTSEASTPFLVPKDDLVRANSVTWILSIFSTVGSPIIGGFILARFSLTSGLYISVVLFALAIAVKFIMKVLNDLVDGTRFAIQEHKIKKILLSSVFIGLFLIPLTSIALPVLVSIHLEMEETFVGLAVGNYIFGILFRSFINTSGVLLLIIAGFAIIYSLLFLRIKE